MIKRTFLLTLVGLVAIGVQAQKLVETQRQYLSGRYGAVGLPMFGWSQQW